MEIKTTMKFHLTLVRIAKIKKKNNSRSVHASKDVEQEEHFFIAGESTNLYIHFGNEYGGFSENWD